MTERKKVLLAQSIHPDAEALLEERFDLVRSPELDEETVRTLIDDVDGLLIRSRTIISAETLEKASKLRVIGRTGVGVENIDIDAATKHGVAVANTPGANTISVAEHAMGFILALAKQLPIMDKETRKGNFDKRYSYIASDVAGKTLGLFGLGVIAQQVAKIAHVLEMDVVGWSRTRDEERAQRCGVKLVEFDELFSVSDILSLHLQLTEKTRHIVGEREISLMKPNAILINTARGGLVDEKALTTALLEKKIAGACLDVFEQEPPEVSNPLFELDNVIATPHTAALTKECVRRMAMDAAQGVVDVLEGREPRFVYNPEALKK